MMPDFTQEEINLICLYDPGNLAGLIEELHAMSRQLMPDEQQLRDLTMGLVQKLRGFTRQEYEALNDALLFADGGQVFDNEDAAYGTNLGLAENLSECWED